MLFQSRNLQFRSLLVLCLWGGISTVPAGESWKQFKFDAGHSGNVPGREVSVPLGLAGSVALTDAVFTAPAVADGRVFYTGHGGGLQASLSCKAGSAR